MEGEGGEGKIGIGEAEVKDREEKSYKQTYRQADINVFVLILISFINTLMYKQNKGTYYI